VSKIQSYTEAGLAAVGGAGDEMIAGQLQLGCAQNRFLWLAYQPQVRAASKRMARVEALVRWDHLEGRRVDSQRLVSIAEGNGMIEPLTTGFSTRHSTPSDAGSTKTSICPCR